ncbi:major facilitator superfamily domain-containing protein [Aspergillus pseudonomiae]|nr:major facilitator superfamily domain-containing protein [Aspergillus pseudonomiae]
MTESSGIQRDNVERPRTPPGTVYFGEGPIDLDGVEEDSDGHVILQPQPSNDPNEPLNWPTYQKAINFGITCLFTLMVFTTLDVGTVTWPALMEDLGYGEEYLNNSYASGLAGMAIGCIFFIPAADLLGRKPVYMFASFALVLSNIGSAVFQTRVQYIVLQAIAGLAGSVNDTIIQMTTYLSLIPTGYIINSQGWRWVWWWCAILNGLVLLLIIFAYEETRYGRPAGNCYIGQDPPGALGAEEKQITASEFDKEKPMPTHCDTVPPLPVEEPIPPRKTYFKRMTHFEPSDNITLKKYWRHMWTPFVLIFRIPAVAFVGLQYSFMMVWVAILATTQPILFAQPPYNFTSVGIGNINIAPFVGAVIGSIYGGPLNDYYVVYMARRRGGIYDPELRLHMLLVPMIILPLGLFLYGTSIANEQPWIVPLIGSSFVGFGIGSVTSIVLPYYGDSYCELVAEGLVVITVIRNAISTGISFAINPWMTGLGVQNMFISAGCVCFGIMLFIIPMIIWGKKTRISTADYYLSAVAAG